jgi:purine-binding chemotaxis protein CheW
MSRPRHLVLARVDALLLGFDIADVREVLGDEPSVSVPLTPPVVRGLINLRGEVVTVIDARRLLQVPPRETEHRSPQIVVQHGRELLSLAVDDVLEVTIVDPLQAATRPDGMHDAVRRLTCGIVRRDHDLVIVVDVGALFERVADVGESSGRIDDRAEAKICAPS